ncbi:MAG: hypothetical protein LBQ40_05925 [Clostridiales bacterium]|nr:hypothetical protein [Clostridiales bacterium]
MKIKIKVKSISKLKDLLTYEEYDTEAATVEDLIREAVFFNVSEYNKKRDRAALFLLSDEAAAELSAGGKVSFGDIKNKAKVDARIMQDEAVFGFKNGRFKIINQTKKREYKALSDDLGLSENDALIFIKLTLLSGRWF